MPSYIKREYSDMYINVEMMFLTLTSLQQLSAASQLLLLLLLP